MNLSIPARKVLLLAHRALLAGKLVVNVKVLTNLNFQRLLCFKIEIKNQYVTKASKHKAVIYCNRFLL